VLAAIIILIVIHVSQNVQNSNTTRDITKCMLGLEMIIAEQRKLFEVSQELTNHRLNGLDERLERLEREATCC
jgi:hypothetical protein